MSAIEIIVIIIASCFVLFIFGSRIYKLVRYKRSDTCEECHNNMKRAVKRMHRQNCKRKKQLEKQNKQSL